MIWQRLLGGLLSWYGLGGTLLVVVVGWRKDWFPRLWRGLKIFCAQLPKRVRDLCWLAANAESVRQHTNDAPELERKLEATGATLCSGYALELVPVDDALTVQDRPLYQGVADSSNRYITLAEAVPFGALENAKVLLQASCADLDAGLEASGRGWLLENIDHNDNRKILITYDKNKAKGNLEFFARISSERQGPLFCKMVIEVPPY